MAKKKYYIPPRSPYGLLQEDVIGTAHSEWLVLVICMLLNCTTRKQVEKIFQTFIQRWPSPNELLNCDTLDLSTVIKPLGFSNRRSCAILKMTKAYVSGAWTHASELPGIGKYGSLAWEMFCQGIFRDDPPVDHALVRYWRWAKQFNKEI